MKKKIFKLLTGMLLSCALAGSTVAVQAEEAGTDTVKSYLTGEDVSVGIGHRRPIAVMLGNDTNGAPQSGTENAGVIYEAPVEGSITRLMAIIEDYDNIPRIGSVRSCRDYFLFYANAKILISTIKIKSLTLVTKEKCSISSRTSFQL